MQIIKKHDINDNLIDWTQSLLTDKLIDFIIDKFINSKQKIE